MAFDIKTIPRVKAWIEQFDLVDRYAAELLLQSLNYVSFSEFEKSIQNQIEEVVERVQQNGKTCVAVFPVSKNLQNKFNENKEVKSVNDSSGRIGHALKNLERKLAKKIEVSPRVSSMSQRKVRHIIYVDDFIGSGKRFVDFWRKDVSKSVKSWVSGGYCKIWIVSHTVHSEGLSKIIKNIKSIDPERIIYKHHVRSSSLLNNDNLKKLMLKYSSRTNKPNAALGYGKNCSPVVFQYGCPNNAPAILWANGKPNNQKNGIALGRWDALFSERSIDTSLYPLFENNFSYDSYPELLWTAGQYKLALEFCESVDSDENTKLYILILALSSKKYSRSKIDEILIPVKDKSDQAIETLIQYGLLNDNMKLTIFGKDVLESNRKKNKKFVDKEYENFYPSSYLGFRREI
ncbi:TPA: hypothetical protein NKP35_004722 [Vibrio parahaemolyticus]|nr:hypothetical protein [Vibrio parahaemolyticus]HCH1033971.1 hypothetical protein [Vibrio parahaemolyticus]